MKPLLSSALRLIAAPARLLATIAARLLAVPLRHLAEVARQLLLLALRQRWLMLALRRPARFAVLVAAVIVLPILAHAKDPATKPTAFLRYNDAKPEALTLEAAVVTYHNDAGVVVHLVSAVHVGERAYFQSLENRFAQYDKVLYEMVKPKDAPAPKKGQRAGGAVSGIQRMLTTILELEFQLDEIDYSANNFVHADLDAETFVKMQKDRGESLIGLMLKQTFKEMMRDQKPAAPGEKVAAPPTMLDILQALRAPDRARQLKKVLGRQMEDLERMSAGLSGPDGSVILTERNKRAMEVFDETVKTGATQIAIFYGAAHMPDLEKRLLERGFKIEKTEWIVAWDMSDPTQKPATQPAK